MCGVHNHPAAEYLGGHSYVRRLLESKISAVIEMLNYHV